MLTFQSSKAINWLLDRDIVKKDYYKQLSELNEKISNLKEQLPNPVQFPQNKTPYFACIEVIDELKKIDSSKDIFGRSNSTIRSWEDIVSTYSSKKLHLAESADRIAALSKSIAPALNTTKNENIKQINHLTQKIKDYTSNLKIKEENMKQSFNELGIKSSNIKLELLEKAMTFVDELHEFVSNELPMFKDSLELYQNFSSYTNKTETKRCPALALLIEKPDALLFELKYKKPPSSVEKPEDLVKSLYEAEKRASLHNAAATCDDDSLMDIEVLDDFTVEVHDVKDTVEDEDSLSCDGDVAKDQYAKWILDTLKGRHALLSDLMELQIFLSSFSELISDGYDFGNPMTNTLCQDILHNAPPSIQKVTPKEVAKMADNVNKTVEWLSNTSNSRLMMVRFVPGYFDRLLSKIGEQKSQCERTSWKISQAETDIKQLEVDHETYSNELEEYRQEYKDLVNFLEKELKVQMKQNIKILGRF